MTIEKIKEIAIGIILIGVGSLMILIPNYFGISTMGKAEVHEMFGIGLVMFGFLKLIWEVNMHSEDKVKSEGNNVN